jgi:fructose-1,6-bisphosphatase/inositol monophosphatase family enzyme
MGGESPFLQVPKIKEKLNHKLSYKCHKQMYVDYMGATSPSERYIRRDIARTFPDHEFFKEKDGVGQESLFNVMKV